MPRVEVTSVKELSNMHSMGHTCANLSGDLLFVWGGTNDEVAYCAIRNTSIWIYETLTGYWRHRTCSGDCPPYLSSCASCLIGQRMYIFGGHSTVQDNWMNSLYCLDLETFIWTDLGAQARAQPTKPIRSDKNVAWSYGGKLFVFGGYGWSQVEHYLELLDCQKDLQLAPDHRWPKFGWNNQLVEYNPARRAWSWPSYSGRCPSARAAHSGALVEHLFYLFGGRDSQKRLNDLYTFDMRTRTWQQLAVIASDPSPRSCHPPIRHLLEEPERNTAQEPTMAGAQLELQPQHDHRNFGELMDGSDDLEDEENHLRIVEEMHDVREEDEVEDEEDTGNGSVARPRHGNKTNEHNGSTFHSMTPSSSSEEKQVISDELDAKCPLEDEEDFGEDEFEYAHPSHMLERWSLSSSSNAEDNLICSAHLGCHHMSNQASLYRDDGFSGGLNQNATLSSGAQSIDSQSSALATTTNARSAPQRQLVGDSDDIGAIRDISRSNPRAIIGSVGRSSVYSSSEQLYTQPNQMPTNERNNTTRATESGSSQTSPSLLSSSLPSSSSGAITAGMERAEPDMLSHEIPAEACVMEARLPAGRSFFSLTPISENCMLLFGGVDSQDRNLDDCWLFDILHNRWTQIDCKHKLLRPRLWHTGARTKQNEVVIIGGSCSEKIDEYCSDILLISLEPKSLKRLSLDSVSRFVRMRAIQKSERLPSTLIKQIRLRKQAIALTTIRSQQQSK